MTTRDYTAYIPLFRFACEMDAFAIAPGVHLQRFATLPPVELKVLAEHEKCALHGVGHWLVIDHFAASNRSTSARMNHWAFALWFVRSTQLKLRFRFEKFLDGSSSAFYRLHSSPTWNDEDVEPGRFTAAELAMAQQAFIVFESVPEDSRLGMALSLTAEGNWQHRWHAGIVMYSAAVETLLTSKRGAGLSARLAQAYAALIAPGAVDRSSAVATFRAAYEARSGIMHGRNELEDEGSRLRALALWSGIIRDLWRVVVAEPAVFSALQGDDSMRAALLAGR